MVGYYFNNLLYSVKRRANAEIAEHYGARFPLDVNNFKGIHEQMKSSIPKEQK